MTNLKEWLAGFPQVSDIREVRATIEKTTYSGVMYLDSVFDNKPRLYLLGKLPACYVRSSKTAFVIDGADWYIACYMQGPIDPKFSSFHPCGENFMLCKWEVPSGEPIDRYNYHRGDWRPYNRVPIKLM